MNIIFQSGEFYGVSDGIFITLMGAIIGALISGVFAIIVFKWGLKKEKQKNEEIERKRISDQTDFLKTSMLLIQEKTISQSNYLVDFSHELKKRDFKDKTLHSSVALKIDGIKTIPYTDLYKIFISKNRDNAIMYNEFQAHIELINSYKEYLPYLLDKFNDSFHKIQKEFGEAISKFSSLYDEKVPDYNNGLQPELKEIIEFWASQITKWRNINEKLIDNYRTDPYIVYDSIIKPVIDFIRTNHFESSAMDILYAANNCESQLKNFDHARYMNRKKCLVASRELIKTRNKLNEIIKNCL
jgi:hypothetical protein